MQSQLKPIGIKQLDATLTMLAELLLFDRDEPLHLIVCGGSALIALELLSRTTRDLDVLALCKGNELIAYGGSEIAKHQSFVISKS